MTTDVRPEAALLQTTLSHLADFAYSFDRAGRFLFVNQPLLDLWGLRLCDAVGRNFFDLQYPTELATRLQDQIQQVFERGQSVRDETEYSNPLGRREYYEYIFNPVFGVDGSVELVVGSTRVITQRREAQSALLENEKRHREVLESIKDHAIFTLDPRGDVKTWNAGAQRIFGYSEREIVGRSGSVLWIPEDQARGAAGEEMETARLHGRAEDERLHQRKDGSQFFATGSLHVICNSLGETTGYTKICRDVTEEHRTLEELREVRRRLETALIAGEIGTWVLNLDTNQVYADQNLAKLFQVSEQEAQGGLLERYLRAIHPDDLPGVMAAIDHAREQGSSFEQDYRIAHGEGWRSVIARGRFECDASGRPVRMPGVVLDVTSRKMAEDELRTVRERFGLAIEAAELGTFYCPMPLGDIHWNDTCMQHFWLPPGTRIDFDLFYSILHPDDRERVRDAVETAVFGRTGYDIEYRTVSPEGQIRWIHAIGRCFYAADGEPSRFDGITVDVTERHRFDDQREEYLRAERAARSDLERANHIKDEFLATLSHELRTPLNAILGWTQVLRSSPGDVESVQNGLTIIERNARAQTKIIEDLLDMSRIISGKVRLDVQAVDLAATLEGAVQTAQPAAEARGVRIVSVVDPLATMVSGDPNRLQQVFWNLLSNAVKFTTKDGRVHVLLQRTESHVEVTVTDTGEGISPEFLPHVFDRFRQSDASSTRKHGGLGLGLAIVKQLVELHGGSITARSEGRGLGATFVVQFPLAATRSSPTVHAPLRRHPGAITEAVPEPVSDVVLHGVSILVVDDEPEARGLVRRLLEDRGARVTAAASAQEGLEMFRRERPDLLISDIGMPDQDGLDLIRQIRALGMAAGGAVPAIALTAYARSEDRMKAIMAGFQLHLSKPVEARELLTMSASLLGRTGSGGKL
ncbi:hypothetical protein BH09VER1_BH09VER1_50400 [soil metagenome]